MRRSPLVFWIVMALIVGGTALLMATNGSGEVFGLDDDRFARMLYLSVWALVLCAVFVRARIRRQHALRNAVLWLLVLVLLVAGYQYRFTLATWFGA